MPLSFVVASEEPELAEGLIASGRAVVKEIVAELADLPAALARQRPDALLVDLGADPWQAIGDLERVPGPLPVLLVYGPDDNGLMRRAMRLGAREYLDAAETSKDELLAAVEHALRERRRDMPAPVLGPMIAVMGSKGGVGTTFVACQLAASLAHRGGRVAIADMKLRLGDVALYFDLRPQYSMVSVATAPGTVDAAFLHTVLAPHRTGVRVLAAPERPEEADSISSADADRALALLRQEHGWVVVDLPPDFDERSVHALDRASHILIVTTCDVPALNHARVQLDLLKRLGHAAQKIHVVVNRMDKNAPVQGRQISDFLRRAVDLQVPNDYPTASTCVNEGRPLWEVAPKSGLRAAFEELNDAAHRWCGIAAPVAEEPKRGLLAFIQRRRHGAA
jgi:pilus assembly protein CpaE